jgi:hypothetical protein
MTSFFAKLCGSSLRGCLAFCFVCCLLLLCNGTAQAELASRGQPGVLGYCGPKPVRAVLKRKPLRKLVVVTAKGINALRPVKVAKRMRSRRLACGC